MDTRQPDGPCSRQVPSLLHHIGPSDKISENSPCIHRCRLSRPSRVMKMLSSQTRYRPGQRYRFTGQSEQQSTSLSTAILHLASLTSTFVFLVFFIALFPLPYLSHTPPYLGRSKRARSTVTVTTHTATNEADSASFYFRSAPTATYLHTSNMASHRIASSLRLRASPSLISPSCSSASASNGGKISRHRLFSITALRCAQDNTYYVATLPWADKDQDRKERFNELIQNAGFTENDHIVASSITTSKRASPIASSLKAEIEHLNSTADKTGGGAWLLLKANTEEEAKKILHDTNAGEVFDLDKSTLQVVELDQTATEGKGPLYDTADNEKSTSSSTSGSQSHSSPAFTAELSNDSGNTQDLMSGNVFEGSEGAQASESPSNTKSQPKSRRKKSEKKEDKTDRNASENAAVAEESRIGGHEVETSGPLYNK
ncbi:hypothetical protein P389DRAFT_175520 [Cystobasidium minutum MCA 4210]|uniref:uncharacterized protein n=1 Tax=Cystobasidium minutum MCA 4210 TaxID=1397322 RepID=UPI0034CE2975|eukprot:jgi/Rhomi1/175520/fgenesh1_kg.11_\